MKKSLTSLTLLSLSLPLMAQTLCLSHQHGFYESPFQVAVSDTAGLLKAGATIRYTLDGSVPTSQSAAYSSPLQVQGNTLLRAAVIQADTIVGKVATATYLFLDDILNQPDLPAGYPETWGNFTTISGVAPADYGMDPEMTGNTVLAPKIRQGFLSLPVLSIVTDKDNLFSHENDSVTGGIYIFTGPPVGDSTGHGWTRPANIELFGQNHDLNVTCGLRLHGGHGRLAEKNPKHSFRLVFKKEYGKKTLKYPLFGEGEPEKFDQLILRCHFGNAWQHWSTGNHAKAQYTRDVWARRMQREMGWTSSNALYVHLFLNGMYWGLYNIAERVDAQFGKDHLDCKKDSVDVVKIEESGGNHHEAGEGTLDAWNEMVDVAGKAADNLFYNRLQGLSDEGEPDTTRQALLDIDNFIDYMLINQYGGNGDWDHHNWFAIRERGQESKGYRFICWDSEIFLEGANNNVLDKNNGGQYPTGIFQNLLQNQQFARRYLKRAKELLADDGLLGPQSAEALWDSLYNVISLALYDESARWGDYRRDVHPWQSRGALNTVDETYMTERNRMHNEVFPTRSAKVLASILSYVDFDDFEAPDNWIALDRSMFHKWSNGTADAEQLADNVNPDWCMRQNAGGGTTVAGFVGVLYDHYADITGYQSLVIRGSGASLRILCNRIVSGGDWKEVDARFADSDPYYDNEVKGLVIPIELIRTMRTHGNADRPDSFVHLNAIKADWGSTVNVSGIYLVQSPDGIDQLTPDATNDGLFRDLNGQVVIHPQHGVYIRNGKKIIIK